jgi:ATP-dependent RNA helicase RhlE
MCGYSLFVFAAVPAASRPRARSSALFTLAPFSALRTKGLSLNFEAFQLDGRIASGVAALGYSAPTPIQREAIPPCLAGKDVLGLAQTGTGKTAAFALPILQRLLRGRRGTVRALVVAPTRELAEQIQENFVALGKETGLRSTAIYGGVAIGPQFQRLRAGVDVVVACPGRLLDHLTRRTIDLSAVEVLVLDEADRMFDMGFLPAVRRIVRHLPSTRQTLLFSATMPDDIRKLVREIQRDPVVVQVDRTSAAVTVSHALYPVEQSRKTALLLEILGRTQTSSVLVFTRTKHRAKRVAEQLSAAGHAAASLQGNLSQGRRQAALSGFRDGSFPILVATDIAARGIDVSTISHGINYDIPDTVDAYTHRIGRTGRAARSGEAFTLVCREDEPQVKAIERALGSPIERRVLSGAGTCSSAASAPPSLASRPAARRPAGAARGPVQASLR